MNEQSKMVAVCGLICSGCDMLLASEDSELAQKIADWFRREKNEDVNPEDIHCSGCKEDRDKHWSPDCSILRCCVDKSGLEFCYQCEEFPCEKLEQWATEDERYGEALNRLKEMKTR